MSSVLERLAPLEREKGALRLLPNISQAATRCQRWQREREKDDQFHLWERKLKGLECISSAQDWKYRAYCVTCSYWALNTTLLIKHTDLFHRRHKIFIAAERITGCILYSHPFFMRNNQLLCRSLTNAVFYLMCYCFNPVSLSVTPFSLLQLLTHTHRRVADNDNSPSPPQIIRCPQFSFLV